MPPLDIYNTHSKGLPPSVTHLQSSHGHTRGPGDQHVDYLCSNDKVPGYDNVLVHNHAYGQFTHKKLACLKEVVAKEWHARQQPCNIVFLDSDTVVHDKARVYSHIECYHPHMKIDHSPGSPYYVSNTTARFLAGGTCTCTCTCTCTDSLRQ